VRDPFLIEGPACISFSGGRTSGYMLWRILQAHHGKLPEDVVVCFANTGKEMPQTLDFVQECSKQWSVPIVWLEYCESPADAPRYKVVNYSMASRNGEPFEAVILKRKYLPSPMARFCTVEMKILTIDRYCRTGLEWSEYETVVGIRADEQRRAAKILANPSGGRRGVERTLPLYSAGITVSDILTFWDAQDFDLQLPSMGGKTMHGNCDLCFLKGREQVMALIREDPRRAEWWIKQENWAKTVAIKPEAGLRFRADRPTYTEMHRMATQHGELFAFGDESIEDCACTD